MQPHSVNDVMSIHYDYEDKIASNNNSNSHKEENVIVLNSTETPKIQQENFAEVHISAKNLVRNCSETLCKLNNRDTISEDNSKSKISSHIIPQHDHRKIQSDTKDIEDDTRYYFVPKRQNNLQSETFPKKIIKK